MSVTLNGFIRLHRKITDWEWYQNPNTFRVFLHCLLKANFTDGRFEGIEVKRGQFVTSLPSLSVQTSLSVRQVRVALDHLILTGELTSKSYPKYRIITVVKYNDYQNDDRQDDSQMTGERQANDSQVTGKRQQRNNNNKGIMEEGNNTPPLPPHEYESDYPFNAFWSEYPKKVKKPDAERAWKKIPKSVNPFDVIDGLRRWKNSDQWTRDGGRFIPNPATWLNAHQWEDDVPAPSSYQAPANKPDARDVHGYEQRSYENEQQAAMARMMTDDWGMS